MLFHFSEEPDITRFEPRTPAGGGEPVVWAIDAAHHHNYLLPRQCPRVTYYAAPDTTPTDVARFLGSSPAVVAIEAGWMERLRACQLYGYRLPAASFECIDAGAGYFVSRSAVVPLAVDRFDDLLAALLARGVELRILPSLWALHDAVAASSLQFSIMRMRNAAPRPTPPRRA